MDKASVSIADLAKKIGSIYKLVILTARRAIEINEGAAKLVDSYNEENATNVAVREIAAGKITYKVKVKVKES